MSMQKKQSWSELSPAARAGMLVAAVVELVLTTMAFRDLSRRPSDQVRGPKWIWWICSIIQPVGPIAYLVLGRRRAR